jgi:DNA-binding transcriptional LysR family regulator
MTPPAANRTAEMEVFVRVVEHAGFSAAARALAMTPSAVSKLVGRLEARLGVRLVQRSTRQLQLTAEGAAFHERCVRILADLDEAEREAAGPRPRGRVRINANVPFGLHVLLPLVPGLIARHPELGLDVVLTDQVVDLMAERADLAIRVGPLRSSQLMARKLGESPMVVVGAPGYLAQRGTPSTLADLARHELLRWGFTRSSAGWPFVADGAAVSLPPTGTLAVGDGESMRRAALAGAGLARLAWFHVGPDIDAGHLVPVLEDHNPGDHEAIHAIYLGQGGRLPARIRAVLDYLVETVRLRPPSRSRATAPAVPARARAGARRR